MKDKKDEVEIIPGTSHRFSAVEVMALLRKLAHAAVKRLHALLTAEAIVEHERLVESAEIRADGAVVTTFKSDVSTGLLVVSAPLTLEGVRTYEMDDS